MKDENKVAIAKTVMDTREKLLKLISTDDGILIEAMFFAGCFIINDCTNR